MFTVTDLTSTAGLVSGATAISPSGVVLGTLSGAGFIWTPNQPNGTVRAVSNWPHYQPEAV